jgi:hypothetical protein
MVAGLAVGGVSAAAEPSPHSGVVIEASRCPAVLTSRDGRFRN